MTSVNEGASVKVLNSLKGEIAEAPDLTGSSELGRINKRIRTVVAKSRSRCAYDKIDADYLWISLLISKEVFFIW